MIVSIFVYLYFFLVPENDFGSLSSCYIKAIVRRLSSPDHFWCFNPLGQFFNSVYTRGFHTNPLYTCKNNTGSNYLPPSLQTRRAGVFRELSIFCTYQEEINNIPLCPLMCNWLYNCGAFDQVKGG